MISSSQLWVIVGEDRNLLDDEVYYTIEDAELVLEQTENRDFYTIETLFDYISTLK